MGAVGGVAILGGNFEAPTFPEDKVVQRSLTAGTQESSAIDAIILDALPLGAPGQLDSHAFLWKGHSHNGSPHTIDWKAFVNVTADDGTGSLWTLQTRIDGAPYTDILTVDDNGLLTVSGATFTMDQLIIDSDNTEAVLIRKDGDAGDVFIVDTVNDVVRLGSDDTLFTFGASSDVILERVSARVLQMNSVPLADSDNELRIVARDDVGVERYLQLFAQGTSQARVAALRADGGGRFDLELFTSSGSIEIWADGVQRWNFGSGSGGFDFELLPIITNRYDIGTTLFAVRDVFTNRIFMGQDQTSAYDAITIDGTDLAAPGQQDSGAIILTGLSNDGSPHDADWRFFVNVTSNAGASEWRLENRIDAAGFADKFVVDADGGFDFPDAGFNVAGTPTVGSRALTTQFDVTGTGVGQVTAVQFDNFVLGIFGDTSQLSTFRITSAIETPAALETLTVSQMVIDEPQTTIGAAGSVLNESVIFINKMPIVGDNTYGLRIRSNRNDEGGNATAAIFIGATSFFGGPGQLDSDSIWQQGHSNDGGGHTADWKFFVGLTANDGTSAWTLQHQLDGGGFVTKLTIDDAGNLTIPGSFTVDGLIIDVDSTEAFLVRKDGDAGDVFIVDTVNDVVTLSSAASLNWSTDLKLFRDGPWELALRDGTNANFFYVYGTFTDSSNYERLALYAGSSVDHFLEPQSAGTGADSINLQIKRLGSGNLDLSATNYLIRLAGGSTILSFTPDNTVRIGQEGATRPAEVNAGTVIRAGRALTTPGDAIILDIADLAVPGTRDSHAILWTGHSNNGGAHDIDWKAFVDVTANDGTGSLWKLATRIDGAGYADKLEIDDDGSFHIIQQGPHSFGGPLSGFTRFNISGAFTSDGTGSQMEGFKVQGPLTGALGDNIGLFGQEINVQITTQTDVTAQNMGDIAALNVLEPQITDNMTGNITRASTVRILSMPTEGVENFGLLLAGATQAIEVNNTEAFLVRKFPDAGDIFTVDTTNETVKSNAKLQVFVDDALAFFVQKAGGGGPGQDIFAVDTSASGFPPGNIVRVISATFKQESSSGRNTFGTATAFDYVFLRIAPSQVISGGASDEAHILLVEGNIQGFSGDTARINVATFTGSVTTQNVAEAVTNISQVQIDEPTINLQGSSTVTDAQSLLITGAPTEGDNNYALRILGGDVQLPSAGALQWSTDLKLFRDGPWELALRDGTNDNFFYVYGTFTDSSNYERLALYAGSSILYVLEPQSAGSGNNTINMVVRGLGGGTMTVGQADNGGVLFLRGPARFETGAFGAAALGPLTQQQLVATPSGQTATATMRIPAGSLVLAITARVVTTVTGPATFSIGDGVDVDRWGAGIAVASGTTSGVPDFTSTTIQYNLATAADVVITSDGVDFTGGEVRIIVYYMQFNPPLS